MFEGEVVDEANRPGGGAPTMYKLGSCICGSGALAAMRPSQTTTHCPGGG